MPCFNPMIAFLKDDVLDNPQWSGSKPYRFSKADKKNADLYQSMLKDGNLHFWKNPNNGITYSDTLIPCRQCLGCRMDYSRQWANRMILELGCHDPDNCYFLTLTYDPDLIPRNDSGHMTLEPDHMTAFLKRLRDHQSRLSGLQIRYYYSGEYGDMEFHPHYHMIAYSLVFPDLKFLKFTERGDPIYTSKWLDEIWSYGFCFVGKVSWEDCAYVAGYVMKKLKGKDSIRYDLAGIQPEFARMSRRPGIGSQSFSIENFEKGILRYVNGRPITVPDSWKRLMLGSDLDTLSKVKDRRSLLQRLRACQASDSDYLPSERLSIMEKDLKNKKSAFKS